MKILGNIRLVFQGNSCPEIMKTYFWAPKWGVDLYTGSTYTQVNMVSETLSFSTTTRKCNNKYKNTSSV